MRNGRKGVYTPRKPGQTREQRLAQRRDYHFRSNYGMSVEEYNAIVMAQEHKCAICERTKKLYVDHCHKTGKVRQLLCHSCNVAIGLLQEDPNVMLKAIEYLKKFHDF